MSQVPNFTRINFADTVAPAGKGVSASWATPEGIAVKPVYNEKDLAGLGCIIGRDMDIGKIEGQCVIRHLKRMKLLSLFDREFPGEFGACVENALFTHRKSELVEPRDRTG